MNTRAKHFALALAPAALLACAAAGAQAPEPDALPAVPNPDGCVGLFAGYKAVDIHADCRFSEVIVDKGVSRWTCPAQIMVLCPLEAFGKFSSEGD